MDLGALNMYNLHSIIKKRPKSVAVLKMSGLSDLEVDQDQTHQRSSQNWVIHKGLVKARGPRTYATPVQGEEGAFNANQEAHVQLSDDQNVPSPLPIWPTTYSTPASRIPKSQSTVIQH